MEEETHLVVLSPCMFTARIALSYGLPRTLYLHGQQGQQREAKKATRYSGHMVNSFLSACSHVRS